MSTPAKTNPEVAAMTFRRDLDRFWDTGAPAIRGWERRPLDPLTQLITLIADDEEQRFPYFVRARADWYPDYPPQVAFVEPDGVTEPPAGSMWLPSITTAPFGFSLHPVFEYRDESNVVVIERRQLLCFSQSFDYYISGHNAQPHERWHYPGHTVAATLNRLNEVLQPPYYAGPQGVRDEQAHAA